MVTPYHAIKGPCRQIVWSILKEIPRPIQEGIGKLGVRQGCIELGARAAQSPARGQSGLIHCWQQRGWG
jgi:hypothetical protein